MIISILSVKPISCSHSQPGLDISLEAVAISSCGVSVDLPGTVSTNNLLQYLTRTLLSILVKYSLQPVRLFYLHKADSTRVFIKLSPYHGLLFLVFFLRHRSSPLPLFLHGSISDPSPGL